MTHDLKPMRTHGSNFIAVGIDGDESNLTPYKLVAAMRFPTLKAAVYFSDVLQPRDEDVLLGRGPIRQRHPGNVRYTELIHRNKDRYYEGGIVSKKLIVRGIVDNILVQGQFLKRKACNSAWMIVSKEEAMRKIAHAIRYLHRKTIPGRPRSIEPGSLYHDTIVRSASFNMHEVPPREPNLPWLEKGPCRQRQLLAAPLPRPLDVVFDREPIRFIDWRFFGEPTGGLPTSYWLDQADEVKHNITHRTGSGGARDDVVTLIESNRRQNMSCCYLNLSLDPRTKLTRRDTSIASIGPQEVDAEPIPFVDESVSAESAGGLQRYYQLDQVDDAEDVFTIGTASDGVKDHAVPWIDSNSYQDLLRFFLEDSLLDPQPSILRRNTSIGSFDPREV